MLYITSTPIGNLEDITLRALNTLKQCDYIICEDTRHTKKLLQKYDIHCPLVSFHGYSGKSKENKVEDILKNHEHVALVSDAGTPGISDPGYTVVQLALKNNITVTPLPGAAAFLTALQASGLPIHNFTYLGFLPLKKGRHTLLTALKDEKRTVVFYESVHRIVKTIDQLIEYLGEDRPVVIGRELTKMHEEFIRGTLADAKERLTEKNVKGEFVVILGS